MDGKDKRAISELVHCCCNLEALSQEPFSSSPLTHAQGLILLPALRLNNCRKRRKKSAFMNSAVASLLPVYQQDLPTVCLHL